MEKRLNNIARVFLLTGTGILLFLAPIKFGTPTNLIPKNIFQWIFSAWPIGFFHTFILVLFVLWLVWVFISPETKIKYSSFDLPAMVFIIAAIISVFTAYDRHGAHIFFANVLDCFILYFLVLNIVRSEKDFFFMISVVFVSSVLVSFYGIYQYYIGLPETREFAKIYFNSGVDPSLLERLASNRIFSTFIYPNTLTGYLLLSIPVVLGTFVFLVKNKIKNRLVWIFLIICMFYALLLTFHRGIDFGSKIKNTSVNRIENWKAGIGIIKDSPLLGVGLSNFGSVYPKYKLDIAEETQFAHNNFIQVWAEQGIFGFIAFCIMWFVVFKNGVRGLRKIKDRNVYPLAYGIFIGIILFVFHNLIDFDWYIPGLTLVVFALIGIFLNITEQYKEKIFIIKKTWIRALIIILILLCFLWGLIKLEKTAIGEYYFEEAKNIFNDKNLSLSEVLLKASVNMDDDNSEAYFMLGKLAVLKNDYLQGISYFKKAINCNKCSSVYYYNLALSYIYWIQKSGDFSLMKSAGEAFDAAVKWYPVSPFYRLQLAQFYETNNHPELALIEYNYCLELNGRIEREYNLKNKILRHIILSPEAVLQIKERIDRLRKG
jgi:putative inorganic carbon (HCO3(-)) transporter